MKLRTVAFAGLLMVVPPLMAGSSEVPLVPTECCLYAGCPDGPYGCADVLLPGDPDDGKVEVLVCKKDGVSMCPPM